MAGHKQVEGSEKISLSKTITTEVESHPPMIWDNYDSGQKCETREDIDECLTRFHVAVYNLLPVVLMTSSNAD